MMGQCAGLGFARFMEMCGRRVVESGGELWHSCSFGMYMSLPYQRRLDLDYRAAGRVVSAIGAIGIRYPSLTWQGLPSGLYVCRRRDYDIPSLHRNFRALVRHGLPNCEIRRLTERELMVQALEVNRETMLRQHRYDPQFGDDRRWRRVVRAIEQNPCMAPVGAFIDGTLASYAITCCEEGWLHIVHKMNSFRFDERHPSQVLDFSITRRIATDPDLQAVSMGWAPLVPHRGLHEYKLRLGYDFEPQSSVIRLHPALDAALRSRLAGAVIRLAERVWRESQPVHRAAAVLEGARQARHGRPAAARTGAAAHPTYNSGNKPAAHAADCKAATS